MNIIKKSHFINFNIKTVSAICLIILINALFIACDNVKERKVVTTDKSVLSTAQRLNKIGINISEDKINKYDKNGCKHGLWIEDNGSSIIMTSFVNGAEDGCEMVFNSKPEPIRLHYIIIYHKDEMNSIITFDDEGMIIGVTDSIRLNNEYPEYYDEFKYIGNDKNYKDGRLQMSGLILLGEEWERDCEFIGQWKIYSDDGSITLKNFEPFK